MYKGNSWEILVPKHRPRIYFTADNFRLERADDAVYDGDVSRKLEEARREAVGAARKKGQDLRPNKLLGFAGIDEGEDEGVAIARLNQLDYITFGAAVILADRGDPDAAKYGANFGVMTTVRTVDGKSMHSRRRSDVASWGGYDSLFGCGLTGDQNGDASKVVEAGTGRLFSIVAERVAVELGINDGDISSIELLGVVEGKKYGDHTFSFDTEISVESGKVIAGKDEIEKRPAIAKKYESIFPVGLTGNEIGEYMRDNRRILEVASGGIVLMVNNLFGPEQAIPLTDNPENT